MVASLKKKNRDHKNAKTRCKDTACELENSITSSRVVIVTVS